MGIGARRVLALLAAGGTTLAASAVSAAPSPRPVAVHSVVAIVGDTGVNVLHEEYRTRTGGDVVLPRGIGPVVKVTIPFDVPYPDQVVALRKGPLGHPDAHTSYYIRGTRLLIRTDDDARFILEDTAHGTATTAMAGGATLGAAPDTLIVFAQSDLRQSYEWLTKQNWIDVSSESVFNVIGGVVCESAKAVHEFHDAGHLAFVAAGQGPTDTFFDAPAGSPHVIRVGGVYDDGSPMMFGMGASPTSHSGRLYDVGGLMENEVPLPSGNRGVEDAGGTSLSSPEVAGRTAWVLERVRAAVGDRALGVRKRALVVASKRPKKGPLADGRLAADELADAIRNVSRPFGEASDERYFIEGYGWFNDAAAKDAVAMLLGRRAPASRAQDDEGQSTAYEIRGALYATDGCGPLDPLIS